MSTLPKHQYPQSLAYPAYAGQMARRWLLRISQTGKYLATLILLYLCLLHHPLAMAAEEDASSTAQASSNPTSNSQAEAEQTPSADQQQAVGSNKKSQAVATSPAIPSSDEDSPDYSNFPLDENKVQAGGGIIIEGDRLDVHLDKSFSALGNAVMKKKDQLIEGDRLEYDTVSKTIHSVGNAKVVTPDTNAKGKELHLSIDDFIGQMTKVTFVLKQALSKLVPINAFNQRSARGTDLMGQDPFSNMIVKNPLSAPAKPSTKQAKGGKGNEQSRGDAEVLFFEGQGKKRAVNAKFTSCEAGQDDWFIKSNEIKFDDNAKEAVAKNATIEFKGVPILYSPRMSFPYGSERKSGFLSPIWGTTSKSGFEIMTPYYINLGPNRDATITGRVLSKRGEQLQGEYRYLEEGYSGYNQLHYMPSDNITGENRYLISSHHKQTFGEGWYGNWDYDRVSDFNYFAELGSRLVVTSRVNLLQQATLGYNDAKWQFNISANRFQTLSEDKNTYPYQRLPVVNLNFNDDFGAFNVKLINQAARFELGADLDSTRPTGNRLVTYPSISLPLATSYAFITPKLGVHHTSYRLNSTAGGFDDSFQRTMPIFSVDSGLLFEKDTRVVSRNYALTMEPRLFYVYIPYRDQSNIPLFDTTFADLNMATLFSENQFAGFDRINNANQVTLSVASRMIDAESGKERLSVSVGQRFYFTDQRIGLNPNSDANFNQLSDFVTAMTASLTNRWDIYGGWQFDTKGNTNRANLGARYAPEPGKVFNFSYRYIDNALSRVINGNAVNQLNVSGQWPITPNWYAVGRWNYSIEDGKTIQAIGGLEYDAGCWQSRVVMQQLSTATTTSNYALFYQLELGGMASIGASPFRLLTRNIPGYTPTSQFDNSRFDQYE